jgi:hypothetical protein
MNFPDWQAYQFPTWLLTDEAKAFYLGVIFGALVRLFRACLRWFSRAMDDRGAMGD